MLHYLREAPSGAASTRVFLHGFTGSTASWDAVVAHLDAAHTDVALRIPGHDPAVPVRSMVSDPHAPDAFARMVQGLNAALDKGLNAAPNQPPHAAAGQAPGAVPDALALPSLHLIGYSMGARLALGMLLAAPERIRRVTLLGVHPGLQNDAARAARAQSDATWEQVLREEGMAAFTQRWLAQPLFAGLARLPSEAVARDLAARKQHDPAQLADALAATSLARMPSFWPALPSIRVPVVFATGADDEKFVALLQGARAATPASTLQIIPGAGHNVLLEAPKSVARLIMSRPGHAP